MEDIINEIMAISNTLEDLNLPPTIDNMNKLLGCQQHLIGITDKLRMMKKKEENNGDPTAE